MLLVSESIHATPMTGLGGVEISLAGCVIFIGLYPNTRTDLADPQHCS